MVETTVIIVGAGPSGLAAAVCLTRESIPYVLLEREDCYAPLWKKKAYDRLHLHLAKQYTQLPYMKLPPTCPKYISKNDFIQYLDNYVAHFNISPLCRRRVVSARFDHSSRKWCVVVRSGAKTSQENGGCEEEEEVYVGRFLVVASGEASDPFCPKIEGLDTFNGKVIHTTEYKCGKEYEGKNILVVGAGNSGMGISLDLANHGAHTSIVIQSPVHILSRGMVWTALFLFKYLPSYLVDNLMVLLSKLVYGNVTKYGFSRPSEGPFYLKTAHGKYPIIDVLPAVKNIRGNEILFEDGRSSIFDAIIFATGFTRSTSQWLQGDDYLLNEDGLPKPSYPNHWKGQNGLYCAGLARRGIYGLAMDAKNIALDIKYNL